MSMTALLFPGQGAQYIGMGKDLAAQNPAAADVFRRADAAVGYSLSNLCWDGPGEDLMRTVHTQPALVATSLACLAALEAQGVYGQMVAGHSIGEFSALGAARVLSFEDAIRLASRRGEFMEASGNKRPGGMSAVLSIRPEALEEVCQEASSLGLGTVVVANLNAHEQIVISGDVEALKKAEELAQARGARRVIRLPVSGAFHSPLMQDAAASLASELDRVTFHDAQIPVVSSCTTRPESSGDRLRDILKSQITSRVLWQDTMEAILAMNPGHVIEVGPGTALSGMLKRASRTTTPLRVSDVDSLQQTVSKILQSVNPAG